MLDQIITVTKIRYGYMRANKLRTQKNDPEENVALGVGKKLGPKPL